MCAFGTSKSARLPSYRLDQQKLREQWRRLFLRQGRICRTFGYDAVDTLLQSLNKQAQIFYDRYRKLK
jgi:hypothetical protein